MFTDIPEKRRHVIGKEGKTTINLEGEVGRFFLGSRGYPKLEEGMPNDGGKLQS